MGITNIPKAVLDYKSVSLKERASQILVNLMNEGYNNCIADLRHPYTIFYSMYVNALFKPSKFQRPL